MTLDELIGNYNRGVTERGGCGGPVMIACMLIAFLLMGCKSVSNKESFVENHRIENLMSMMDSLINRSHTVQQDSSWRETVIKELQSIKERSDTNHIVVMDTAGNVIRETTIINNTREVTSESTRLLMEGMIHKMDRMDSVMSIQNKLICEMDSLLRQSDKETTIEKKQSWWEALWQQAKGIIIGIVFSGIVFFILRLKKKLP